MFEIGDLIEVNPESDYIFSEMESPFEVIYVEEDLGETFLSFKDVHGEEEHGWSSSRFKKWESPPFPEEPVVEWWLEE